MRCMPPAVTQTWDRGLTPYVGYSFPSTLNSYVQRWCVDRAIQPLYNRADAATRADGLQFRAHYSQQGECR